MRIVTHFHRIGDPGSGVARATLEVARLLAAGGNEVTLLTASGSEFPDDWPASGDGGPHVVLLEQGRGARPLSGPGLARAAEALRDSDVLHLNGVWRPVNTQLASLARRLGTPYVLTPHGMLSDWPMGQKRLRKRLYYLLVERRNLAAAARVPFPSEAEKGEGGKWVPHDRVSVVPVPIGLETYSDLPGPGLFRQAHPEIVDGEPTVLFLSRLHPKKGAEVLIEAIGLLGRRGVDCRLLLAGSGEEGYVDGLRRLVERCGIADRTRFLGSVIGRQKLSLYQHADLLALPTSQENFGQVLAESLACGTPVVTTRGADIWREIRDAGGGVVAEREPEAFAAAIEGLLADEDRARRMGEAGRAWVCAALAEESLVGGYDALFRQAAQASSA